MEEVTGRKQGMFENVPPKFTFVFGLVLGIAAFSLFGYVTLLSRVSGTTSSTNSSTKTAVTNDSGNVAGDTTGQDADQAVVDVKPVSDTDYIRGNKDASVTFIEYSDLECPFCKNFHSTVTQVLDKYGDNMRYIFRHYPLSFHANAQKEAEAAECVGELGGAEAFFSFIDKIFERTTSNGTGFALDALGPLAKEVGVSQSQFQSCLDSGKYAEKVQTDLTEGSAAGVSGTPTSFLLDSSGNVIQTFPGALPFTQVDQAISQVLGT